MLIQKNTRDKNPGHLQYMSSSCMLTHAPDLTKLMMNVVILRDSLGLLNDVSSAAVQLSQLLQGQSEAHTVKVQDLKDYKPNTSTVSLTLWPPPARPPLVSLSGGKDRADILSKTLLAFSLRASNWLRTCAVLQDQRQHMNYVYVTHQAAFSIGPPLSTGVSPPPGRALS